MYCVSCYLQPLVYLHLLFQIEAVIAYSSRETKAQTAVTLVYWEVARDLQMLFVVFLSSPFNLNENCAGKSRLPRTLRPPPMPSFGPAKALYRSINYLLPQFKVTPANFASLMPVLFRREQKRFRSVSWGELKRNLSVSCLGENRVYYSKSICR